LGYYENYRTNKELSETRAQEWNSQEARAARHEDWKKKYSLLNERLRENPNDKALQEQMRIHLDLTREQFYGKDGVYPDDSRLS
jgi:hypothetical protein